MITLGTNGYITREEFEAWANARQLNHFAYDSLQKEAAITIACVDFIDTQYRFRGCKLDQSQAMALPTDSVTIDNVKAASCQATWQQLQGVLFVDDMAQTQREVLSESSKLGDLSESVTYAEGSTREYTYSTRKIDTLLKPYTVGGGMGLLRG